MNYSLAYCLSRIPHTRRSTLSDVILSTNSWIYLRTSSTVGLFITNSPFKYSSLWHMVVSPFSGFSFFKQVLHIGFAFSIFQAIITDNHQLAGRTGFRMIINWKVAAGTTEKQRRCNSLVSNSQIHKHVCSVRSLYNT